MRTTGVRLEPPLLFLDDLVSIELIWGWTNMHTLATWPSMVDTGAAYHYIINNRKTAFAPDPITLAVANSTIRQNSSLVESNTSAVQFFCNRYFLRMEEFPGGSIDYLIRGVAKDINNRIRRVKNACLFAEV